MNTPRNIANDLAAQGPACLLRLHGRFLQVTGRMAFRLLCVWGLVMLHGYFPQAGYGQEMMQLNIPGSVFNAGDTLSLQCLVPQWTEERRSGVLHVWIEDTEKRNAWKLRFPVLAGSAMPQLVLDASLPAGNYALYCQLHTQPFFINARLKENYRRDSVRFTMVLKNETILTGGLPVKDLRRFWLGKLVFEDQATIYFSPDDKARTNYLDASIATPLDSPFTSLADTTIFFAMGKTAPQPEEILGYKPGIDMFTGKNIGTLRDVEVVAQKRADIDKFNREVTSGFFKSDNGYVFDGLNNQFSGAISILDYLRGRVPGLQFQRGSFPGGFNVTWRGATPNFFLNEVEVSAETIAIVPPSDVAMIKVFRPPFLGAFLGGPGGAIAVYTRTNGTAYSGGPVFLNRFVVNGYTPMVYVLRAGLAE